MKTYFRYLFLLLLINILLAITGYILFRLNIPGLIFSDLAWLLFSFSFISVICMFIFFRGQKKEPAARTLHLLIAFGLKMLMEMVLALLWFFVGKKTAPASLILFFIVYLAFTLFSTFAMLNSLKTKSLEKQI